MLEQIGVSPEAAAAEIEAMEPIAIGRTRSRVVLGSMNEMMLEAYHHLTDPSGASDLRATSQRLATSLYGQLGQGKWGYGTPVEATRRAIGAAS
jgi:hypothetical protein